MCLDTSITTEKNDGQTTPNSQLNNNSMVCSGSFFKHNSATISNKSQQYQEANESLKHKSSSSLEMSEKRKKLPPGYVNVITNTPSVPYTTTTGDEEIKTGATNVSYVNTEYDMNAADLTSRDKHESQGTQKDVGEIVGTDTKTFKFGLAPLKPEIPIYDSYPLIPSISPPPLKQKLSPQKVIDSTQRNSGESYRNNQIINSKNEVLVRASGAIFENDESIRKFNYDSGDRWYTGAKGRSFSSSFVADDFSPLVHDAEVNVSLSDSNIEPRKHSSKAEVFNNSLYSSKQKESDTNKENSNLNKNVLSQCVGLNPFNNSSNVSTYQNIDPSTILNESNSHSNKIKPELKKLSSSTSLSSSVAINNNSDVSCELFSHTKQYVNSAGGGCVSPISDSSPHILITSENYFPYDQTDNHATMKQTFSATNPFLPLMKQDLKVSQANSSNPFLSVLSDEQSTKSQIDTHTFHRPSERLPSQGNQLQSDFSNTSSFPLDSMTTTGNPVHVHHHHFYHAQNQPNVNINLGGTQTINNHSSRNEPSCVNFTSPPLIDFPIANQTHRSQTYDFTDRNMRLVLKPKKEPLSYKDLEYILSRNKFLLNKCGWYYGKMRADESTALLCDKAPGTFLLRDSSDPKYWFSLSMQRGNIVGENGNKENSGPTSIRIHFVNGKFQLDAEDRIRTIMPEFDTIVDLVQYYVSTSLHKLKQIQQSDLIPSEEKKGFQNAKSNTLWVDSSGKLYQTIFLAYPLYKKEATPSLSHLCRLSINTAIVSNITKEFSENIYENKQYLESTSKLDLPFRIRTYLKEYPNVI